MRKALLLISLLFLTTPILLAQQTADKFMVKGICEMCKNRIEKAAMDVKGVSMAEYCLKSKALKVKFDESMTNTKMIQKAVAKVGHDTEMYKADDKVYNKLPACCKYRDKMKYDKSKKHKKK